MKLNEIYRSAARAAHAAGVDAGDEGNLLNWVRQNCQYGFEHEFYIFLGIGCELADIQAQGQGYQNEVHRAFSQIPPEINPSTSKIQPAVF